jgi:hypothetical protein
MFGNMLIVEKAAADQKSGVQWEGGSAGKIVSQMEQRVLSAWV